MADGPALRVGAGGEVRAVLEIRSGPSAGARLEARPGQALEIGRLTFAAASTPPDRHMSARHFELACDGGDCRIRDLGSTNGTYVNGARVSEAQVREGDVITAGQSVFLVRVNPTWQEARVDGQPPAELSFPSADDRMKQSGLTTAPTAFNLPLLDVVNTSPFATGWLPWEGARNQAQLSVVVKATFGIASHASVASPQFQVFAADVISDEHPQLVRFESDLVPFKPRTDVALVGRAYAPGGKPVSRLMAGLRVGDLRYGVAVFGDRTWQWRPIAPPTISEPEPFTSMDLVYERAFGGIDGPGGMYCKENLVGTGFIGKETRERVSGLKLPNIEDPRNLISAWDTHPRPVGFGFYGRGWMPRLAFAGTYDEKYMKERHPLPPEDFSYRLFNGAHPDLQVEGYLRGDEEVVLVNVCPRDPDVRFRLPGLVPKITVARWTVPPEQWIEEHLGPDGNLPDALPLVEEAVKPVLDTLVFVPDEGIFYEVFRGVCRLSSLDSLEVARITIGL